ncbi:MAG: helix-turn-helix domain-containing protein [Candidatus Moranbacteria bacterium]|nr:helix-turn-helix domain-containing protein [Candidatus Moranbacteria bacterium]
MENTLENQLKKAGLTESEAKVYLASLELGETNINRISKKSGIKRSTTYWVIDSLKEKGLISILKRNKKTFYFAEDPRKITWQMEENLKEVGASMPGLLAIANFIDKKPSVRFFEGQSGIKEVFKDTLCHPKQEILAWFPRAFESFIDEYYVPRRIERKIWVRAIMPDSKKSREFAKAEEKQLRRSKLVSEEEFNLDVEITLYGENKVGIISFEEEIAMMIESRKIHNSLKNIFEIMWKYIPDKKA